MLIELKIENFGIAESLRIRPRKGLNVISGETGAGKSLIMNALCIVLGARATPGLVRNGAHRAIIEAVFEIKPILQKELNINLNQNNNPSSSSFIEVRREITTEGRSKIYCNGEISTLQYLRNIAQQLIEIHGQHEHQRILDCDTHLDYLDIFANTKNLCREVTDQYHRFHNLNKRLRNANIETEERENRRDFLHFAIKEIEDFAPQEKEFENLTQEQSLIQNSGRLFQDLCVAYSTIREEEFAILDRLVSLIQLLEAHTTLLPEAQEYIEQMQEANYLLETVADFLREQKSRLQFSPERLEDINQRIAGYRALYKKYGGSTKNVLNIKEKYISEIGSIDMSSEQMQEIENKLKDLQSVLIQKAEKLSQLRRSAIQKLEGKMIQELEQLGMFGAKIQVHVKREIDIKIINNDENEDIRSDEDLSLAKQTSSINQYSIHEKGFDRIEFFLVSNPGEAPRPLRKIASGGELSRISLAFKNVFCEERPVQTLVFDEVDAGVGGEIAHAIANRLKELAKHSQTIVVTHLPQIASLAEQHFCIQKRYLEGRVSSHISLVEEEDRLHELARMLGGITNSSIVIEHARELLQRA